MTTPLVPARRSELKAFPPRACRKLHVCQELNRQLGRIHYITATFAGSFTVDLSNQLNEQARTTPADEIGSRPDCSRRSALRPIEASQAGVTNKLIRDLRVSAFHTLVFCFLKANRPMFHWPVPVSDCVFAQPGEI